MRPQTGFNIIKLTFLLILSSFITLQAEQSTESAFSAKYSLAEEIVEETTSNDSAETVTATKVRTALVGKWESPNFMVAENGRRDTNGRSLKYHFRTDGTYTKVLGDAEVQVEEQGTWSLSSDGAQLLMQSKSLCDGQMVTHTANIKHLVMDELVLEQTLCVAGTVVSAEPKSFYFNKY